MALLQAAYGVQPGFILAMRWDLGLSRLACQFHDVFWNPGAWNEHYPLVI